MNKATFDYLMDRADRRRDRRDSRDYEDGRRGRRDMRDYEDGRRGRSRGGNRGGGRRDRRDSRDYEDGRDYEDYEDGRDYRGRGNVDFEGTMDFADRDYGKSLSLSKADMHQWKQMMQNEDGTHGPHYDMQQIMSVAEKMDIDFDKDEFDEKEFCMAINMMYSDYCKVAKKYVSPDKELMFFAELAKAFLCDEDGPGPSEKLALYYNCIVDA